MREKKYERVRYKIVRTKPEPKGKAGVTINMKKEIMLRRLKEKPWMAEILRKNFTEDELDKAVAKFLQEDSVCREEKRETSGYVHRHRQK